MKRAAAAIIAALSVQSSSGTSFSRTPRSSQSSAARLAQLGVGGDAAAEGHRLPVAGLRARGPSFATSCSTIARW